MYSRAYSGYYFFVLLLKVILCKQLGNTLKLAKIIYICILYLKYLETYLETLHSHFQPNCHLKRLKNLGSVVDKTHYIQYIVFCTRISKSSNVGFMFCFVYRIKIAMMAIE